MKRSDPEAPYVLLEPTAPPVPLLVSIPHTGVELDGGLQARLVSDEARALPDTDWHLHRLYAFAPSLGATVLHARFSRTVVDLNRPPDASPLYPDRAETGLVPTRTFAGAPLYAPGDEPTPDEIAERVERYWRPYHDRLAAELRRLRERCGYALLFDAHSITSVVPDFFEGELPGLVLGDADGSATVPASSRAVREVLASSPYESSHNHPFKGGYITRHYGRPAEGVQALQLEMAQRLYMQEGPPFAYEPERASALEPVLVATLLAYLGAGTPHAGH